MAKRAEAIREMMNTEGWRLYYAPEKREKMALCVEKLMEKKEPSIKTLQNLRAEYKAHQEDLEMVEEWANG